jgi:membrane protease YdiL (CAAX protease family)
MAEADEPGGGAGALFRGLPKYVPSTPWGPLGAFAVTFIACVASFAVVLAVVLLSWLMWSTGSTWAADVARAMSNLADDKGSLATPLGVGLMIVSQLTSLAVIWLAAGRKGMRREVLRLGPPKAGWGASILGGLIVVIVTGALELAMHYGVGFDPFTDSKWLAEGLKSPLWWGTALVAVVLAPLWEELTFRGFLLSALAKSRLGFWPAALVSSVTWTGLHMSYSLPGLVSVFTAGLLLSWLMWRTGSMRAVVVAHAMANVAAVAFIYFYAPA